MPYKHPLASAKPATAPKMPINEAAKEAAVAAHHPSAVKGDDEAETPNVEIIAPDANATRPKRRAAISDRKITAQDANAPIPDNNVPI